MARTSTPPKATVVEQSGAQTVHLVQWASTRKAVYAITHKDSDALTLETRTKRLPLGPGQANRIAATVRAAIQRASA